MILAQNEEFGFGSEGKPENFMNGSLDGYSVEKFQQISSSWVKRRFNINFEVYSKDYLKLTENDIVINKDGEILENTIVTESIEGEDFSTFTPHYPGRKLVRFKKSKREEPGKILGTSGKFF